MARGTVQMLHTVGFFLHLVIAREPDKLKWTMKSA